MPFNTARARLLIVWVSVGLLTIVVGFYSYARLRARRMIKDLPKQLGVDIQRSTSGFSLSKSEKGRTLFTIRAASAVERKGGGIAELRDVSILVYGRQGDRYDQIHGAEFDYDPKTGEVHAQGEVEIDLQGNAAGTLAPDQQIPRELKNPIHLKTSGLVFNRNSGLAHTSEMLEFATPQVSGSAMGVSYDSHTNILTLESKVKAHANGPQATDLTAQHGTITREPRRMVLNGVEARHNNQTMEAGYVTVYLRDDNTVDHAEAAANVRVEQSGVNAASASANRADLRITAGNLLRVAVLTGDVKVKASGSSNLDASAGKVTLDFAGQNELQKVHAEQNVRILQQPAATHGSQSQNVELTSEAMDFAVRNGKVLERADTAGPAQIVMTPQSQPSAAAAANMPARTAITATHFTFEFARNRLRQVTGTPDARVVSSTPGQPDRVTTSHSVDGEFQPEGGLKAVVQEGNFEYHEGDRAAWAQKAAYSAATDDLVLTGSPRVVQGGLTTTAQSIHFNRRSGDAVANGDVKSTYSDLKPQPGGALLAGADPIHVTAATMTARREAGKARYSGGARLWQGANVVQAPAIEFTQQPRTVVAQGSSGTPVLTVFVQPDKGGKTTPVNVTAQKLSYEDAQRKAAFEGGVLMRSTDGTITADHVDVFLKARGQGSTGAFAGSQLDSAVALGGVVVQQLDRKAVGNKVTYTAEQEKFVMTGGPPSIFDAEHGKVTGDSLTFYSRDGRVQVESGGSTRTITQTRVAR